MQDIRTGDIHGSTVIFHDQSSKLTWHNGKPSAQWTNQEAVEAFTYAEQERAKDRAAIAKRVSFICCAAAAVLTGCAVYLWWATGDVSVPGFYVAVAGSLTSITSIIGSISALNPTGTVTGRRNVRRQRTAWNVLKDRGKVGHEYIEPTLFFPNPNDLQRELRKRSKR